MSTSRPGTDAPRPDGLRARLRLAGAPRVLRSTGIYAVFAVLVSLIAVVTLEITWWGWDGARQQELLRDRPGVVVLAGVIVLLVVLFLLAVTGRMWVTSTIVLGTVTLLGVASNVKFETRREPVYPRDLPFLREPGFLLQMVQPQLLWLTALGAGGLVAFTWALSWLFRLWLRRGGEAPRTRRGRAALYVLRATVAGVALILLFPLMDFNRPANPWRLAFDEAGADWRKASQPFNYQVNGFVGGFLYNLDTPAMAKPPGYSQAELERITAEYTAAADRMNEGRRPGALDDVNVVVVLAESFSDPTLLEGFELAEDPIPRTRALMEQLPHGLTLSPKVGGGTSSMEFEALTGMSLAQFHPTMDVPYQMLVPNYQTFPSVLGLFEDAGHTTIAIHPNTGRLYERNRTYPILGFSDFIERKEMEHRRKIEKYRPSVPFISDGAAFRETLAVIDKHDEPVFVNLVTMQNHFPYTDKYPDPVGVTGLDEADAAMIGQYSRGINHTDRSLNRFVKELEASDEKTLLVYYGDHLPGYPGTLFEQNSHRSMHEPPFFIYSNFKELKAEELPTTSPIFFLPRALDMIGAPLPPYFVLLRELEKHIPAMTHATIVDPDDREISPEELSPEAREVLRDYRLVQYDLAIGERYAEKLMHPTPIGTLTASDAAE